MALGAIEAIEAAGGVPGEDIKIVSIDAVKDGMQALVDGKINYIVECNPLLGELAAGLVKDVLAGKDVEKKIYVEDQSFTQEQAAEVIDVAPVLIVANRDRSCSKVGRSTRRGADHRSPGGRADDEARKGS